MQAIPAQEAAVLLQLLDEQAALFEQWLVIDEKKRRALIDRNCSEIEATVAQQTKILQKLEAAERKRLAVLRTSSPKAANLTWRELTELVPKHMREHWSRAAVALRNLLTRVQESNARSDALLRQAIAHNQVVLGAVLGQENVPATYNPAGRGQAAVSPLPAGQPRRINEQA